ncbi:hypothetical protein MMC31_002989 [Peltigera leucophlebia]|nr:hypothetical protein [Peltigera leucophlebia]
MEKATEQLNVSDGVLNCRLVSLRRNKDFLSRISQEIDGFFKCLLHNVNKSQDSISNQIQGIEAVLDHHLQEAKRVEDTMLSYKSYVAEMEKTMREALEVTKEAQDRSNAESITDLRDQLEDERAAHKETIGRLTRQAQEFQVGRDRMEGVIPESRSGSCKGENWPEDAGGRVPKRMARDASDDDEKPGQKRRRPFEEETPTSTEK